MTLQDIIYIFYFDEVWDEWVENNYPLDKIIFDDNALHDPSYINEHQRRFMMEVANRIFKSDKSIKRVEQDEILDLIIIRRNDIFRGYFPPP